MSNKTIKPNLSGSVIVSWDFSEGFDTGVLLVGMKKPRKDIEIINAFQGQEALDIYKKLTTLNTNLKGETENDRK